MVLNPLNSSNLDQLALKGLSNETVEDACVGLQHKLLTTVTDNRPLLELIREAKAEVTVEELDIDEADIVVSSSSLWLQSSLASLLCSWEVVE